MCFSIGFRDLAPRKHSFRAIVLKKMLEETNPQRLSETQDKKEEERERARGLFFGKTKAKFPSSSSFLPSTDSSSKWMAAAALVFL